MQGDAHLYDDENMYDIPPIKCQIISIIKWRVRKLECTKTPHFYEIIKIKIKTLDIIDTFLLFNAYSYDEENKMFYFAFWAKNHVKSAK